MSPASGVHPTWAGVAVKTLGEQLGSQTLAVAPKHLQRLQNRSIGVTALSRELGVSKPTLYRRWNEWQVANGLVDPRDARLRNNNVRSQGKRGLAVHLPDELLQAVRDGKKTANAVALEIGCNSSTVYSRLREYKAPTRKAEMEAPPTPLEHDYDAWEESRRPEEPEPEHTIDDLPPLELQSQPPPHAADALIDKLERAMQN